MFHLSDPTINAIVKRLKTDLNAYIDVVNQELTDPEFPIDYPAHVYDFIPTTAYLTEFPTIAVGDGTIDFADDTGYSATANMEFAIIVYLQAMDQRQLSWKLRRYMIALSNCLLKGRSFAFEGGGWGVVLGSIEPGPTLGRRENPKQIMSFRALTLSVRDEQDQ